MGVYLQLWMVGVRVVLLLLWVVPVLCVLLLLLLLLLLLMGLEMGEVAAAVDMVVGVVCGGSR